MRAFIFSLDAFVAFTLALIAIYSLVFFSSVPSAYYYLLTQSHYLSRDVLYSLSTTNCDIDLYPCSNPGTSLLDNVVFSEDESDTEALIVYTVGQMVPTQFGYVFEVSDDGDSWRTLYNTSAEPWRPYDLNTDAHNKDAKKLSISTYVMVFSYPDNINKMNETPYNYNSCGFGADWEEGDATGSDGSVWHDWGIITCGEMSDDGSSGGSSDSSKIISNTPPEVLLGGDLVPEIDVRLVRFTIFI